MKEKNSLLEIRGLYPIFKIAEILNLPFGEVLKLRDELCINPAYETIRYKYYRVDQFNKIEKYYPMKTTVTFHIYESKMNTE